MRDASAAGPFNDRGRRTLEGHKEVAWEVAFSHDGRYLASGGYDNTIKLHPLETRQPQAITPGVARPEAWGI